MSASWSSVLLKLLFALRVFRMKQIKDWKKQKYIKAAEKLAINKLSLRSFLWQENFSKLFEEATCCEFRQLFCIELKMR